MVAETLPVSGSFNVQPSSCAMASAVRAPLSVYHTGWVPACNLSLLKDRNAPSFAYTILVCLSRCADVLGSA